MKITLQTKFYPEEGDFQHVYSPLRNFIKKGGHLSDFTVSRNIFPINVNNPISIECQPSYDGTVNLIITDDENPIRLINSRFTKTENNRFKIISRDQIEQTNLYKEESISSTNLVLAPESLPKIKFKHTRNCGVMAGGNYTFYMKYVDGDGNESDFVAETFQIPIFKGTVGYPKTISGTLLNERTDKAVVLLFTNLDTSFHKIKLYYSRETSDINGYRQSVAFELVEGFDITDDKMEILITGREEETEIGFDVLNAERFEFTSAKTQCQQQNMLFLGNISKSQYDASTLRNLSLFFKVEWVQDENVGWVNYDYTSTDDCEYYSPENVCYKTGYWPSEFYRLGVVYVFEDGSHSDVFNLRGCRFSDQVRSNLKIEDQYIINGIKQNIPSKSFLDKSTRYENTYGVFRNPMFDELDNPIINYKGFDSQVLPLHYKISLQDSDVIQELKNCGVKYCFFVRQKRIPTILFQGLSLDVDKYSGSPMLWDGSRYYTESFLTNAVTARNKNYGDLVQEEDTFVSSKTYSDTNATGGSVIISPDATFDPELQKDLCGTTLYFEKLSETIIPELEGRNHIFKGTIKVDNSKIYNFQGVFLNENVPWKIIGDFKFSTRFGNAEIVKEKSFFGKDLDAMNPDQEHSAYNAKNWSILRGIYTSYVGVCGDLEPQCFYNVRVGDYSSVYTDVYMQERGIDHGAFYSISDRFAIDELSSEHSIWSGDCYSNTVTIRLNRNFTDPDVPVSNYILQPHSWTEHYKGHFHMLQSKNSEEAVENGKKEDVGDWFKINRGDVNSVPLGMWVTFKLLSSYNLGMRSEDPTNIEERSLVGNSRSFYPLANMSLSSNFKIADSALLNKGYSATVSGKEYYEYPDIPYVKDIFDNRIAYSNIQAENEFKNGYRIFSPIAYQDIDRQYGAIVKLLPWGTNLLCVFEHGIAVIPVNEKALMQSTTGQSIHLYGAGVLQKDISLISGNFGSIWQDSIVKTDMGVYGVDTYAKKIWRVGASGFDTISDMNVQRFLNDNILLSEEDVTPTLGLKNVKSHYNAHKGDVMFTFFNHNENKEWNLCYNERLNKWITRYSWTPICSDNINNCYFSLDKKRAELLSYIHDLNFGPFVIQNKDGYPGYFWDTPSCDSLRMDLKINEQYKDGNFIVRFVSGETSYLDESGHEIKFNIDKETINSFCTYFDNGNSGIIRIDQNMYTKWWDSNFPEWQETGERITSEEGFEDYDSSEGIEYKDPPACPLYLKINTETDIYNNGVVLNAIPKTIVIIADESKLEDSRKEQYDKLLINGFYIHGRAGIFDEMDYTDDELSNQITPTKWYDKQEPFEFEFVINNPVGIHKIFDSLTIISNNVAPNSIEYTIEGDTYSLFKNNDLFDNNIKRQLYKSGTGFKNARLEYDTILNQYNLKIVQDCKNIADPRYGRRLGNIHYKEDSWYATIEPLVFDPLLKAKPTDKNVKWTSTRIRDKFLKVRVKYTGEDLVIITAIKNLCTLSRA